MIPAVTGEWQQAALGELSGAAAHHFAEGGLVGFAFAGVSVAGWAMLLASNALIIIAAWFALESVLVGWPRNLSWVGFNVVMQVGMVGVYFFANPYLQMILPVGLFDPLLSLRSDVLPPGFRFIFDVLLAILVILVRGFFNYWKHRASHELPLLWHFHAVHHSIEDLDAVTDISHPVDDLVGRAATIVMAALIGFEYQTFAVLVALHAVYGQLHHTRAPLTLGPLGKIVVDRNFHLTHHSVDPKYFDRNYSGSLILYDKLFGTYEAPDNQPIETGIPGYRQPRTVWEFATARLRPRS
tara:strand:- start:99 stop:989 length:891 start_codon:yes stop_codon:yes gene_type:complete